MLHISVVSLGKSVASTSLAVGLASFLHDRRDGAVLVELDPSGGDLAGMWSMSSVVGVNNLAGAIAVDEVLTPEIVDDVALTSPLGFPVVVAPPVGGASLDKVCADVGARFGAALASSSFPVVCDAGRWRSDEPASYRIAGASAIVVLFTPDPAGVTRVVHQLDSLRSMAAGVPVLLAVVGENPYPVHEIEAALGGETVRVIPSQRDAVRALLSGNASGPQQRKLKKSLWWRSMAGLVAEIELATGVSLSAEVAVPVGTDEPVVESSKRGGLFSRKKKNKDEEEEAPDVFLPVIEDDLGGEFPAPLTSLMEPTGEATVPNG